MSGEKPPKPRLKHPQRSRTCRAGTDGGDRLMIGFLAGAWPRCLSLLAGHLHVARSITRASAARWDGSIVRYGGSMIHRTSPAEAHHDVDPVRVPTSDTRATLACFASARNPGLVGYDGEPAHSCRPASARRLRAHGPKRESRQELACLVGIMSCAGLGVGQAGLVRSAGRV